MAEQLVRLVGDPPAGAFQALPERNGQLPVKPRKSASIKGLVEVMAQLDGVGVVKLTLRLAAESVCSGLQKLVIGRLHFTH